MIYRITDLNGIFIRDDFTFNEETEIALDVPPAQGLYQPKWNGEKWIESATDIPEPTPTIPTETERLEVLESAVLDIIMGGLV
mgnify:CR=1 FL=1